MSNPYLVRSMLSPTPVGAAFVATDTPVWGKLQQVAAKAQEAIGNCVAFAHPDAFAQAVRILAQANRILLIGVGHSAALAQDAAYRFLTVGLNADAPTDLHSQHISARLLGPEDACVALSVAGSTPEIVSTVTAARTAGASIVGISSFPRSPLTHLVDVLLVAGRSDTGYQVEALPSRLAQLVVLDALSAAVAVDDSW